MNCGSRRPSAVSNGIARQIQNRFLKRPTKRKAPMASSVTLMAVRSWDDHQYPHHVAKHGASPERRGGAGDWPGAVRTTVSTRSVKPSVSSILSAYTL